MNIYVHDISIHILISPLHGALVIVHLFPFGINFKRYLQVTSVVMAHAYRQRFFPGCLFSLAGESTRTLETRSGHKVIPKLTQY